MLMAAEDVPMGEPDVFFIDCDGDDDKTNADHYFDSYSHFGVHENKDARAKTSVLSLCCAKTKVARVYAIECSHVVDVVKQIVETNGLSDVVTVLKGKIEEIEPPVEKVGIIIPE